ncbi:hypothetical protein CesoFtcFv8_016157 [Champsocephalus esox]|uniref:Uncharacterized protein n=1 Tax=Champsocephalus esox TaxID=159716 RepID=A0AAN8BMG2_9TELE|nr:hypothetical protein CesoFtcFv8_016157 [Champsocephalus esox]
MTSCRLYEEFGYRKLSSGGGKAEQCAVSVKRRIKFTFPRLSGLWRAVSSGMIMQPFLCAESSTTAAS